MKILKSVASVLIAPLDKKLNLDIPSHYRKYFDDL